MIKINKNSSIPDCLIEWVKRKEKSGKAKYQEFKGTACAQEFRQILINEQYGICAYTGESITNGYNALTEHIYPCSRVKNDMGSQYGRKASLDLDYQNMLAALNAKSSKDETYGAHAKEDEYNETLFVSPLDISCESTFIYDESGKVSWHDKKGEYTVKLLKLDHATLERERLGAIKEYFPDPDDPYSEFPTFEQIKEISQTILQPVDGKLPRFCFVIKAVADSYLTP